MSHPRSLPVSGMAKEELLAALQQAATLGARWREGRTWSLIYYVDEAHTQRLQDAYNLFFMENALNPTAFPGLQQLENEVVSITAGLLQGDHETAGTLTSGGTESILLAVKTYRDRARADRPEIVEPEMVLPSSAHPAFHKAAHYFGVKPVVVPVGPDYRADVAAMEAAINPSTILLVGSAPSYPHGVVDPIEALSEVAAARGLGLHVDACLGGFLLPFLRRLGYPVPPFDLSLPGVTSISADVHKYGYTSKGASVVLYRNEHLRNYQFFIQTGWSGGIYASPGIAGTRPAGAIAAAWASLHSLGEEGFLQLSRQVMETTRQLQEGIEAIEGLYVVGEPDTSVFAVASHQVDIFAVADALERRGWHMDRQVQPNSLHFMVTPAHRASAGPFLRDLAAAVDEVRANPSLAEQGLAPMYGMMAASPGDASVRETILALLNGLYSG